MQFKNWGDKSNKTIILLHGGGLSWWAYRKIISVLSEDYFVVAVILDGHGEDYNNPFISIEDSAAKLISFIDTECNQSVFAIISLSIGAQIAVETISQRKDITEYAIIESVLLIPTKWIKIASKPLINMTY